MQLVHFSILYSDYEECMGVFVCLCVCVWGGGYDNIIYSYITIQYIIGF